MASARANLDGKSEGLDFEGTLSYHKEVSRIAKQRHQTDNIAHALRRRRASNEAISSSIIIYEGKNAAAAHRSSQAVEDERNRESLHLSPACALQRSHSARQTVP